jgi:hypothetical protein
VVRRIVPTPFGVSVSSAELRSRSPRPARHAQPRSLLQWISRHEGCQIAERELAGCARAPVRRRSATRRYRMQSARPVAKPRGVFSLGFLRPRNQLAPIVEELVESPVREGVKEQLLQCARWYRRDIGSQHRSFSHMSWVPNRSRQ